jgi:hypothetical protein
VKKIKPSYPQRAELLRTPFKPMSDDEFRQAVRDGSAVPCREGDVLIVSKWRDGPGIGADDFLAALKAKGATLMARTYKSDVNIRVLRAAPPGTAAGHPKSKASKSAR